MEVYARNGEQYSRLSGAVTGSAPESAARSTREAAFDGDVLTCFNSAADSGGWVGLDVGAPQNIARLRYLPRNDDNNIREGDLYELFYWGDEGWRSLGKRTGDSSYVLTYDNCPSNALFLLHNHTRGREERIFTYENEKQIWH